MQVDCHIYRSKLKSGLYVYLNEKDNFNVLPNALQRKLGKLEFSFSMRLDETKKLVRLDTQKVMMHLQRDGYFLQMPPANTNFLDLN
ncbi:MAG: YcgL domain-containing protein [Leucothrix sp.]